MAKGSAAAGALTPLRPVAELLSHLLEVTGGPVDEALLRRALTHRSYAYEAGGLPHNERLEFLGDSVLGLVVTTTLYDAHPETSEGQLAKLRAAVVNMRALADVGRTLGLGDFVYLGRGEESTGGRDKDSILADTVEAVIGAVYQSAGIVAAGELVHHLVDPLLAQSATLGAGLDWKTSLQEITSRHGLGAPEYAVDRGRPRARQVVRGRSVIVGGDVLGPGVGPHEEGRRAGGRRPRVDLDPRRPRGPGPRSRRGARPRGRRRRARPGRPPRPVPELPEVEVVRRGLADHVLGRTVSTLELRGHRVARRHVPGPEHLAERLAGRRVAAVRRRGKYLWLDLEDSLGLVLHLGMSGQLLIEPADAPAEKHLHARFRFADDGPELRFVDQRTFGGLALADLDAQGVPTTIAHIAPDLLEPAFDRDAVVRRVKARDSAIKRGAARPDRRLGRGQHLCRRGAVAGPGARRAGRELADEARIGRVLDHAAR